MNCCTNSTGRAAAERRPQPRYGATVENRGDCNYVVTTRNGSFLMSTEGGAVNPVDTLLASLGGCVGHYVHDYLRDQGLANGGFTVTAGATSTPDGLRLAEIAVTITVKGAVLDDRHRHELLRSAERCKVHNTLKAGCEIRVGLADA